MKAVAPEMLAAAMLATLALLSAVVAGSRPVCMSSMSTLGYTEPSGDIALLTGSSLNITCHLYLNETTQSASDLRFFRNSFPLSNDLPGVKISVLNSTSAQLIVHNMEPSDDMYYCKMRENDSFRGICLNAVVVDSPPKNVTDFSCVSNSWQNLTCHWTRPHNFLNTTYSLYYILRGRASRLMSHFCPELRLEDDRYSCFWNLSTQWIYRQAYPEYSFFLNSSNKFGSTVQEIKFDHFAHVIPAPPENLKVIPPIGVHRALIQWMEHHYVRHFTVPFYHKVMYCSELDECREWHTSILTNETNGSNHTHLLENLNANVRYDVRVSTKSETASDKLWSNYSAVTFKTASEPPSEAPRIDPGGFESFHEGHSRKVYIWYRRIEKRFQNGDEFTYKLVDVKEDGRLLHLEKSIEIHKSHIEVPKLPLGRIELTFKSSNIIGLSKNSTSLVLPPQDELLPEPKHFTKIDFDNGTYELSWDKLDHPDLESYTIFWCSHNKERPRLCDGRLNWIQVPADRKLEYVTISQNETRDLIYQFGISANGKLSNSGLVWAACTVVHNKSVSKMRNIWINRVGPTFIEVGWELECSDRIGSIQGYKISYCPIVSPRNKTCKEEEKSVNVTRRPSEIHSTVYGLKPHTTYAITVAVITKTTVGRPSEPLYNNTSEGAPSPPFNVSITDLRNDRMLVSWHQPVTLNGYLKFYIVEYYSNDDERLMSEVLPNSKELYTETLLTNLSSYTKYNIKVKACTVSCSDSSETVIVRTAIGKPGEVQPIIKDSKLSPNQKILVWSPPAFRGGDITTYEIKLIKTFNDNTNETTNYTTTENEMMIQNDLCHVKNVAMFCYSVRAINIDNVSDHGAAAFTHHEFVTIHRRPDDNFVPFEGPWNGNICSNCVISNSDYWIYFITIIIVFAFLVYGLWRLWNYCKYMQNIKPRLPPGLGSNIDKEPVIKKPLGKWSAPGKHKDNDKLNEPTLADSESLLNKGLNARDVTLCDNSNCSENSDSTIAISLTSSNQGASDEHKDAQGTQDGGRSGTLSADSSIQWGNIGSPDSQPTSVTSLDPTVWNSPGSKINNVEDGTTKMTPYSTVGMQIGYVAKTDDVALNNPQTKGYVSLGTFMNDTLINPNLLNAVSPSFAPMQQQFPTEIVSYPNTREQNPPKMELPSGYVMNGTGNMPLSINSSPAKMTNVVPDESLIHSIQLNDSCEPNYVYDNNKSALAHLLNEEVSVPNKPVLLDSGYVMRNDPIIVNGIDTSCLQKILDGNTSQNPPLPKQTNLSSIVMPDESVSVADTALSPEAYCRFGPNTNVPQRFDFQRTDEETGNSLLSSIKGADDYEYEKHLFEEPPCSDTSVPSSHYVPLNLQNLNKL